MTTSYTRSDLEEKELDQAQADARTLIRKYGMNQAVKIIALLAVENARLTNRAARGIDPLPTFKV